MDAKNLIQYLEDAAEFYDLIDANCRGNEKLTQKAMNLCADLMVTSVRVLAENCRREAATLRSHLASAAEHGGVRHIAMHLMLPMEALSAFDGKPPRP